MPRPKSQSLSTMGYISDERVAGWIYLTDSNICLIEGIIANPLTVPSLRRQSLKMLAAFLVDKALSMGYTNIIAVTKHHAIQKLCNDMGFVSDKEFKIYALREKE